MAFDQTPSDKYGLGHNHVGMGLISAAGFIPNINQDPKPAKINDKYKDSDQHGTHSREDHNDGRGGPITFILFIALIALGFYVYYRKQQQKKSEEVRDITQDSAYDEINEDG